MAEASENNIKSSNIRSDIENSDQNSLSPDNKKISKSPKTVSPKSYILSPVKNYSDDKSKLPFSLENHTVSKEKSMPPISSKKYSRKITIDKTPNNQILLSETEKCDSRNSYENYETNSKNIKSSKSLNSSRKVLSEDENHISKNNSKIAHSKTSEKKIIKQKISDKKDVKNGLQISENSNKKNYDSNGDNDLNDEL